MQVYRKRGSNQVKFIFHEKSFQAKANAVLNYKGNALRILQYKNKTKTGSKPPAAVQLILKGGYSRTTKFRYKKRVGVELPTYFYTSDVTPPDFVVKPSSIKIYAANYILEYEQRYSELIGENPAIYDDIDEPYNIRELILKYIY